MHEQDDPWWQSQHVEQLVTGRPEGELREALKHPELDASVRRAIEDELRRRGVR